MFSEIYYLANFRIGYGGDIRSHQFNVSKITHQEYSQKGQICIILLIFQSFAFPLDFEYSKVPTQNCKLRNR